MTNSISISEILAESFVVYKKHFSSFVGIALVCAIINEIIGFIVGVIGARDLSIAFFFNILITSWTTIALIDIILTVKKGGEIDLTKSLLSARGIFWRYVAVTTSTIILFACGFMLFVIPGLYFATIFLFADMLVVIEKCEFTQAFKRSMELIKPRFWEVFKCLIPIVIISSFAGLIRQIPGLDAADQLLASISKISSVLLMPYVVIAQVFLFYKVKDSYIA